MTAGIALLSLAAACAGANETVAPDWVGTDAARRTVGEETPAELPPETLADEASLDYYDATSACFDVIVRTKIDDDAPLGERGACSNGRESAPASPSSETVSVYDYSERGDVETVQTEGTPSEAYAADAIGELEPGLHRIVERHARLCCGVAASEILELDLGGSSFRWEID
jgi:hypothetical protein